jgi:hypothetical protein
MKKLSVMAVLGILITVVFTLPATATAATEFGDNCTADEPVTVPYTLTTLSAPSAALPLTAPSSGVITKVKVQIGIPLPITIPEQVKLLKSAGGNNYTVTNQTTVQAGSGLTVADARMPVQAGERLAMHGLPFSYEGTPFSGYEFYCETVPGSVLGAVVGDVSVGTTTEFTPVTVGRVPLAAVIEPDADNDGFGDETQDKCPQSASTQGECPTIKLDLSSAVKKKGSVVVLVTATSEAPVKVAGTVKLGKGKTAKLSGGKHTVKPGKISHFTLKFPGKLKTALANLPKSQSLKLKVTASATDLIGRIAKDQLKVKLKGQA